MRNRGNTSYYMGISYRSTRRPSLQIKFTKSLDTKMQQNEQYKINTQKSQNRIHAQKRKKRIEQIQKFRNQYIEKKQKKQKYQYKYRNKKYSSLKKFNHFKQITQEQIQSNQSKCGQNCQESQRNIENNYQHKLLSLKEEEIKIPFKNQPKLSIQQSIKMQNGIFNHFPSPIFSNIPIKNGIKQESIQSNKLSNFFIPSNKIKSQNQKIRSKFIVNFIYPKNSIKGKNIQIKKFNLDGTLQYYQIKIPQRPKTSYCQKSSQIDGIGKRDYPRRKDLLSYVTIARDCVKRKQKRKNDREQKIMPWSCIAEGDRLSRSAWNSVRDQFDAFL